MNIRDEVQIHEAHQQEILDKLEGDEFARHLGIEVVELSVGKAVVRLKTEPYMLNAHSTVHGGVIYTLADYAFALACNSYGKVSVGLSTTANFIKAVRSGDLLTATATEEKRTNRIGFYRITVTCRNDIIATVELMRFVTGKVNILFLWTINNRIFAGFCHNGGEQYERTI